MLYDFIYISNKSSNKSFHNKTCLLGLQSDQPLAKLTAGIFLGLILGQITAPSQFNHEQKLTIIVYIIPNFLVLHFGDNFMKIP